MSTSSTHGSNPFKPGKILTLFIDAMKKQKDVPTVDASNIHKLLNTASHKGVKFIGPAGACVNESEEMLMRDLRPPYPVTVLEGQMFDAEGANALIIARDVGDAVELNFMCHTEEYVRQAFPGVGEWVISPLTCRFQYSDEPVKGVRKMETKVFVPYHAARVPFDPDHSSYLPFIRYYTAVCQIMANYHVETEEIVPDGKENRSRRIRGKAPLFTYKTLIIGEPKAKITSRKGGGTHASPRSHLRRGHYRTSKNGLRYWVSASFVNGGTPGFVHKDYELKLGAQNDD